MGLIERLANQTTDGSARTDAFLGGVSSALWDQDAGALSNLLGSLTSASAVDNAINSLDNAQLEALLKAGTRPSMTTVAVGYSASTSHSFDTAGITTVIDTVSISRNVDIKARVFELSARQIDDIRSTDQILTPNPSADDRADEVADALTNLLASDTAGIATSLEKDAGILNHSAQKSSRM